MEYRAALKTAVWLALVLASATAQQKPCIGPWSLNQMLVLVRDVPAVRVEKLVAGCGVDFELTPQVEERLRQAGATDEVVAAAKRGAEARTETPAAAKRMVMEFERIETGTFLMGCGFVDSERFLFDGECFDDEKPAHRVWITGGYEIGKYEVTQSQWEAVMGTNLSSFKGPERPAEMVSWDDAQEFLSRLNQRNDGFRYRLPTEAEWEYAARAGSSGKNTGPVDGVAWYTANSRSETHPVGLKQPNPWGLHDMQGNVWEWCGDWYDVNYYGNSPMANPPGPPSGQARVLRGGSYVNDARNLRFSVRFRNAPGNRLPNVGLRCVRELR